MSPRCMISTSCCGSLTRSGWRNISLTSEKRLALTPMPNARVSTAIVVNPSCLRRLRTAWRRSSSMKAPSRDTLRNLYEDPPRGVRIAPAESRRWRRPAFGGRNVRRIAGDREEASDLRDAEQRVLHGPRAGRGFAAGKPDPTSIANVGSGRQRDRPSALRAAFGLVLAQETFEEPQVRLFVAQDVDDHVLRDPVHLVGRFDHLVVEPDALALGFDHALDDVHDVGLLLGRLQ